MRLHALQVHLPRNYVHLARNAGVTRVVRLATCIALLALVLSLTLTGCGKRNAPVPPADEPDTYPRPYPSE
jgi:hypothetical protein